MWPDIDYSMYKLIVSDLDGTIKDIQKPLDPHLPRIIKKIKKAGVYFTLATGKNLNSTRETAEALGIVIPMIFANGCVVQKLDGTIQEKHKLPGGFVHMLTELCDKEDIELAIHIGEDIFVCKTTYNTSILFDYGMPCLEEVDEWNNVRDLLLGAYKCIAIDRQNRQRLFDLEGMVREQAGSSVEYCHTLVEMVEFMPKGVTKVSGIKTVTENLNIPMSSVLTMGDGNNDIGMLQAAGYSVAVGNAPDAVKEAADWVIPPCADHGPVNFLNHFLEMLI